MADASLKCLVKMEKESLLKRFYTNMQHSTFKISTNFKILHILNIGEVCAFNGAKFRSKLQCFLLENKYFKFKVACKTPGSTNIIYMRLEYSKVNRSSDFTT